MLLSSSIFEVNLHWNLVQILLQSESSCDNVEMMELNETRAVPKHYADCNELKGHHFHDNTIHFDSDEQLLWTPPQIH